MSAALEVEIVTLFPELFTSVLETSMLGRAIAGGQLAVHFTNPRDFATDKHKTVDDAPYGGGAGMVMLPEPLAQAIEAPLAQRGPAYKLLLAPTGKRLTQSLVVELAQKKRLMLVCGRYEGYDERVRTLVDDELSVGDFVLTGGELGAAIVIDAVARCLPGVLGNPESSVHESFSFGTLEHPQYTRPPMWRERAVPEVLLSGNHERIRRWRRLQALERTRKERPDLFAKLELSDEDRALLAGEAP
jgi:tRNA (guanine37-N1)-methyltransferase